MNTKILNSDAYATYKESFSRKFSLVIKHSYIPNKVLIKAIKLILNLAHKQSSPWKGCSSLHIFRIIWSNMQQSNIISEHLETQLHPRFQFFFFFTKN